MARDPELAAALREKKARQRIEHMEGGARNAALLLRELAHPIVGEPIVAGEVRERCAAIIAAPRLLEARQTSPAGSDREALVCFEADALWPLHPLGVLADLERPGEDGEPKDGNDPPSGGGRSATICRRCGSTGQIGRGRTRYSRTRIRFSGPRRVTACIANGPGLWGL